ncbi:MAG: hypothetical protein WD897_01005, partial [Parcubacteria group bacterium]
MTDPQTALKKSGWSVRGGLGFGASPEADWKIILISTIILTVLVIALSVFVFVKVGKGEIFVVERLVGEEERALDTSLLRETVLHYQNKALEF